MLLCGQTVETAENKMLIYNKKAFTLIIEIISTIHDTIGMFMCRY